MHAKYRNPLGLVRPMKKRAPLVEVSANGDKSPPRKRAFLQEPGDFSSFILPLPVACENTSDAPPSGSVPQLPRRNRVAATFSLRFYWLSFSFSCFFLLSPSTDRGCGRWNN